jgi:ABC-type multidrug transport system ATPase subunit
LNKNSKKTFSYETHLGGLGHMQITLTNTGKRYNREWIFRHCDYEFLPGKTYAITGPNGSGKSTLLQVIAGAVLHSEGEIKYKDPGYSILDKTGPAKDYGISNPASSIQHQVSSIEIYKQLSFAAPYLDLIEEMTALELLGFHAKFKPLVKSIPEILDEVSLQKAAHKQIRYFSSGMKQRLKLAQAIFSNAPVLLLDEPLTNLDEDGIALYLRLIDNYTKEKLVIVSSNDKQEYIFCEEVISITTYK